MADAYLGMRHRSLVQAMRGEFENAGKMLARAVDDKHVGGAVDGRQRNLGKPGRQELQRRPE